MEEIEVDNPGPSMTNILKEDNLYKLTDEEVEFTQECNHDDYLELVNYIAENFPGYCYYRSGSIFSKSLTLIKSLEEKNKIYDEDTKLKGLDIRPEDLKTNVAGVKAKCDYFNIMEYNIKSQLEILSKAQETLTEEYQEDNISIDEYINKIMQLNTKIMRIIDRLDKEGDYIPF